MAWLIACSITKTNREKMHPLIVEWKHEWAKLNRQLIDFVKTLLLLSTSTTPA